MPVAHPTHEPSHHPSHQPTLIPSKAGCWSDCEAVAEYIMWGILCTGNECGSCPQCSNFLPTLNPTSDPTTNPTVDLQGMFIFKIRLHFFTRIYNLQEFCTTVLRIYFCFQMKHAVCGFYFIIQNFNWFLLLPNVYKNFVIN